jgi:AraC-like DNA-binding protein
MQMTGCSFDELALIRKGSGWIETRGRKVPVQQDHIVFVPAGLKHRFIDRPGDPLTVVAVDFFESSFGALALARETLEGFRELFPVASPYLPANRRLRAEVADSFRGMLFEQTHQQAGAELRIWCYLAELVVLLLRCRECAPRKSSRARSAQPSMAASVDWLSRNFFETVSVGDLAASAGMPYRSFTECFKQATGETVVGYINRCRVAYAARLMLESDNILDCAYTAGFGDIAHFYRTFKRYVGKTPKAFLNLQREGLWRLQACDKRLRECNARVPGT